MTVLNAEVGEMLVSCQFEQVVSKANTASCPANGALNLPPVMPGSDSGVNHDRRYSESLQSRAVGSHGRVVALPRPTRLYRGEGLTPNVHIMVK